MGHSGDLPVALRYGEGRHLAIEPYGSALAETRYRTGAEGRAPRGEIRVTKSPVSKRHERHRARDEIRQSSRPTCFTGAPHAAIDDELVVQQG